VVGTSGSIYGYRRHLAPVKPLLSRFLLVSILGGLIGARLLTLTTEKMFSKLVPFLILFATILFLAGGLLRRAVQEQAHHPLLPAHRTKAGAEYHHDNRLHYFSSDFLQRVLAKLTKAYPGANSATPQAPSSKNQAPNARPRPRPRPRNRSLSFRRQTPDRLRG